MPDLLTVLVQVSQTVKSFTPLLGDGPLATAAKIVSTAIDTATIFAAAGRDPLVEIQRIHDADPLLQEMRAEWEARLNERFPEGG